MIDIACQFGENKRLSGIMTRPNSPSSNQSLIFLNVGFESKHGPYRLYVQIARMAANHELNSFRFDFGDLGYSQQEQSRKTLKARKNDEIKAALEYVQSTFGINQFILVGLCSGAEDAFRYANLDVRVKGIIMIDTFSYETPRNQTHIFFSRLRCWLLRKMYSIRKYPIASQGYNWNAQKVVQYNYMNKNESKDILENLLRRKIKLHFIYTSGMKNLFTHKSQLWKMFPELKRYFGVSLDFFPTMGHTQLLEEERKCLVDAIEKRLVAMHIRR